MNINVDTLSDGTSIAIVTVASEKDARAVIANFHHQRIGYKRISVTMYTPESPDAARRIR